MKNQATNRPTQMQEFSTALPSRTSRKSRVATCAAALCSVLMAGSVHSADWVTNGSGNWSDGVNWSTDPVVPDGAGVTANFTGINIADTATITLDTLARTVGILNVGDTNASSRYEFTGEDLIFDNGASAAELNFTSLSRDDTIGTSIILNSSLNIANESSAIRTKSLAAGGTNSISSGTAGTKVITNAGTGSYRVWLQKIEDGAGVVSVVQNSATSPIILGRSGDVNTYSGGTTLTQGVAFAGNTTAFGTGVITFGGGTIDNSGSSNLSLTNDIVANADIRFLSPISGSGEFNFSSANQVTINTNVDFFVGQSQVTFSGGAEITDGGLGYSLTKTGDGILFLSSNGISTHTGGTIVQEGTLTLAGVGNHLVDTAPVTVDGGTLNVATTEVVGALTLRSGSIIGSGGTFTASSYTVESGTVSRALAGSGVAMTKTTVGTVELSGANTYTGATSVNAGTLLVSDGHINSSAVTVSAGAQLIYNSSTARTGAITLSGAGAGVSNRATLAGTGSINVAVTLDNIGDTLSPGNSPGILSIGANQTWESFTYLWEINNFTGTTAGGDFDQIAITGSLNLSGGLGDYLLDLNSLTALNAAGDVPNFSEVNRSWSILTSTGGITGFDAANWTISTANFSSTPSALGSWTVDQVGNDLVLSYAAIPEPGTAALMALALMGFIFFRRFRQR